MNINPSITVYFTFYHHSTGIASATWSKTLLKNGVVQAQVITITEVVSNIYTGSFAVDSTDPAFWHLSVHANSEGYEEDYVVSGDAQKARKFLGNNLTKSGSTVTIYEDNGTDVFETYNTTATERTAT